MFQMCYKNKIILFPQYPNDVYTNGIFTLQVKKLSQSDISKV